MPYQNELANKKAGKLFFISCFITKKYLKNRLLTFTCLKIGGQSQQSRAGKKRWDLK